MPGSGADTVLYGDTGSRSKNPPAGKFNPLEGVAANPHPDILVAGGAWFPTAIVDSAVPELQFHINMKADEQDAALAELQDQLPMTLNNELVNPFDMPLHAITIESLPAWAEPRKVREEYYTRYGEHLGIGIYAYDVQHKRWYQRAMHGGFGTSGVQHPFKKHKTAVKQFNKMKKELMNGSYNAADCLYRDYPQELASLDTELKTRLRV